jgi:hypothetical protein
VFGRRRRATLVEAIQAALAADAQARTALAEALDRIDARLERGLEDQALTEAATAATVQHLRATAVDTRNDLAAAVEHLAHICAALSERIDAERNEREVLVATIAELKGTAALERPRSGERVVGGSFPASQPETLFGGETDEPRSRWA